MRYVVHRRFRGICLAGNVNLPYGAVCEMSDNVIYRDGKALVAATSENAHQYFARDDDGNGLERGKLTQKILTLLSPFPLPEYASDRQLKQSQAHNERRDAAWRRIWQDPSLQPYRMREHADHWLWNHAFFNANIETLNYILKIIMGGTSCTE